MKRVAIYGGSFDPPGLGRREIARRLAERFDEVLIVPCGPRPDKPSTSETSPIHRAVMTDITFRGLSHVRVDLFDLENDAYTPPLKLEQRFRQTGEIWHVIPAQFIHNGQHNNSLIHTEWEDGQRLWEQSHYVVLARPEEIIDPRDLPPKNEIIVVPDYESSADLRQLVFQRQPIGPLVAPEVAGYIQRHRLYRGSLPARECSFRIAPKFKLFYDVRNPRAAEMAERFEPYLSDDAEAVVVLGGDGTMLQAIRQHWRTRLPFYGLNLGHVGFLLNEKDVFEFWNQELLFYQLPLLWVEIELQSGIRHQRLAFNDAWVERSSGQTAWMRVCINDSQCLPKVVGDGMLICTAAGSTSYARAMGATPMPFNTRVVLLVGSNVLTPRNWPPAVLPIDSEIEITSLSPDKRPLKAFVDGVEQGMVRSLRVRTSHIAAVELAFRPGHDPASKLALQQFSE